MQHGPPPLSLSPARVLRPASEHERRAPLLSILLSQLLEPILVLVALLGGLRSGALRTSQLAQQVAHLGLLAASEIRQHGPTGRGRRHCIGGSESYLGKPRGANLRQRRPALTPLHVLQQRRRSQEK